MSRFFAFMCALSCALLIAAQASVVSAQAPSKPRIESTRVERAPVGQKGGLMNPVAWCPNGAQPRVRTVVRGVDTQFRRVWVYRGALPGLYFPRVQVGRYRLATTARCGAKETRRVEVVRVKRKTARTTISEQEFRRVKRGMTRARVRQIIGYDGTGSRFGARMWRTYDNMAFWAYTSVEFRNGRVVRKAWDFDHD